MSALLAAAPRLVMPEQEFEFGFVPQNSKITHVFHLYSKGDDSLKIIQVVPGCSCTQAPLKKQELGVGDSTDLEIIFDTRSYQGGVTKTPVIKTNEGPPDKNVRFHADVVARPDSTYPIIIKPYKLDLTQVGDKTRSKISFSIQNVSDKPLEARLVAAATDLFDVALPKSIPAGKSGDGTLTLKKEALSGGFEKCLTIQLNDDKSSRFTIPVKRAIKEISGGTPVLPASAPGSGH
jgi:hypothetical protein